VIRWDRSSLLGAKCRQNQRGRMARSPPSLEAFNWVSRLSFVVAVAVADDLIAHLLLPATTECQSAYRRSGTQEHQSSGEIYDFHVTRPLQDVPGDLERVFDKNGERFTHMRKTATEPVSSYPSHGLRLNCQFGGLSPGDAIQSEI